MKIAVSVLLQTPPDLASDWPVSGHLTRLIPFIGRKRETGPLSSLLVKIRITILLSAPVSVSHDNLLSVEEDTADIDILNLEC